MEAPFGFLLQTRTWRLALDQRSIELRKTLHFSTVVDGSRGRPNNRGRMCAMKVVDLIEQTCAAAGRHQVDESRIAQSN